MKTSIAPRTFPPHLVFLGLGLLLIVGSGWTLLRGARMSAPGRLIAKESLLTWRSPAAGPIQPLAPDAASAVFEVRNTGGTPVRITEVKSSCGCATPRVEPSLIPAGATARVEVRAMPLLIGERSAVVTLRTDSPQTPEVELRLRIIGSRRPPFLAKAEGELFFEETGSTVETRRILVHTAEAAGSNATPPKIVHHSALLHVGPPKLQAEKTADDGHSIARSYEYLVTVRPEEVREPFSEGVEVVDPWDPEHRVRIEARGGRALPLKAVPARLAIDGRRGATAQFLVITTSHLDDLIVEPADGRSPLVVERIERDPGGKRATVHVAVREGTAADSEGGLRVRLASSGEAISVPVRLRAEGRQ